MRLFSDLPNVVSNAYVHLGDLDVSAAYPSNGAVLNICKETTHRELCRVEGIPEFTQRMQGINLSGGHTNSVEFCTTMLGLPSMNEMLDSFITDTK